MDERMIGFDRYKTSFLCIQACPSSELILRKWIP